MYECVSLFDSFIKMPAHISMPAKSEMEIKMEIRELGKYLRQICRELKRGRGGGELTRLGLPLHLRNLHEVAIKATAITRITTMRPNSRPQTNERSIYYGIG